MRKKNLILLFYILLYNLTIYAQLSYWPDILALPLQDVFPDSNSIEYLSEHSLYIRTFKTKDSLVIIKNTNMYHLYQLADYKLTNDSWFETKDQYLDLSGQIIKKNFPLGINAGIEWFPVLLTKETSSTKGILGSIEIGPALKFFPFGIPIKIHSGITSRGVNDSLSSYGISTFNVLEKNYGYFAGAEIGSSSKVLSFFPLLVNYKIYQRTIGNSRLLTGSANTLLGIGLPSEDSIFIRYDDSLTNGRDAFLGQAQGKPHIINDPERKERSLAAFAGIKGKTRIYLNPMLFYSYSEHSLSFLGEWGKRKFNENSLNAILKTDTIFPINYNGSFSIKWQNEENHSFFNAPSSKGSVFASGLMVVKEDGSILSLDDNKSYIILLSNSISKFFLNGMGAEYNSELSRYSKDYPNFFVSGKDTIRRNPPLDNDIIINKHKLTLFPIPKSAGNAKIFFEYSKNITNYLKKEMSGNNTIDKFYRIGTNFDFTLFEKCTLSNSTSADAKITNYVFPETKIGKPPPYSRKFSSLSALDIQILKWMTLKTEWVETYWDYGTWNAKEYLDSSSLSLIDLSSYEDYYAITDKTWEHGIFISSTFNIIETFLINGSFSYKYMDVKQFDPLTKNYIHTIYAGNKFIPQLSFIYNINSKLVFKISIAKIYDIKDNYWDIYVSFNGFF